METPPSSLPTDPLPPPQPPPSEGLTDQQWAIVIHLSGICGIALPTLGNILAPLIFWLIKKDASPFLDRVGKDVLNFQISYTIYIILAGCSLLLCIGYALLPLVMLAWLIFAIIGTVKASKGERYDFPLTIKFL